MALSPITTAWTLDNTLNDSSGNGNTLTNTGSVAFVTGKINQGAQFDTTNKRLTLTTSLGNTGSDRAWSYWVNPTALTGYMFDNADSANSKRDLAYFTGSVMQFYANGNSINSTTITTGSWYHVVISRSSGTYTLYLNNVSQGTTTSLSGAVAFNALSIGAAGDSFGANCNSKIDEFYVFPQSLTVSDVSTLYNGGVGLQYPFTVGGATILNLLSLHA